MRVVILQCGRGIVLQTKLVYLSIVLSTRNRWRRRRLVDALVDLTASLLPPTRSLSSLAGDSNASATALLDTPDTIPLTSSMKRLKKQSTTPSVRWYLQAPPGRSNRRYPLGNIHFSMDLRRVGGKDDGGVDLVGWWWVPVRGGNEIGEGEGGRDSGRKRRTGDEYASIGNRYRGTCRGSNADRRAAHSSSPFTKAAVLRAHSSPIPMFLLHLPIEDNTNTAIWNQALSSSGGVLGGELEVRWERNLLGSSTTNSG
ncbi:hypothetical protein BKA70DRAFT_1337272, partial [Coprinopsis sp. MPI-PUGE-AT-0042]